MDSIETLAGGLILYSLEIPSTADLVRMAVKYGWQGDLWHCYLTHTLFSSENAFSLACERKPAASDSLRDLALADMEIYRALFSETPAVFTSAPFRAFLHDSVTARSSAAQRVCALAAALSSAESAERMLALVTGHYETQGTGLLGMCDTFRLDSDCVLHPVENRRVVRLDDLVGYESQKKLLLENTLAFLRGRQANNVLLYGDAGTGKSTSIQAIACEYADRGLRLIELYKHQFSLIPSLLTQIKGRNYRFILFLDDLSFEEDETEYKHLKAVMEGGAEAAPENVRIYATSNRRHLVRETWNDRNDMEHDGDIHRSDTMSEKLSLAGRFGLQIFYPDPSFEEYHTIVRELAKKSDILKGRSEEELRREAATWQVRRGNRSGRTAQQFINDLICRQDETEREDTHADS